MGVPAFFRWVSARYPLILLDVLEGDDRGPDQGEQVEATLVREIEGEKYEGARWTQIENLFIDCNGVVHPCCHPENGGEQPKNEEEMLENVGKYLDRLIKAIRPTKLLYLALDGVAPRAKMNQQRSRRFCAAREAEEHATAVAALRSQKRLSDEGEASLTKKRWDHNAITPGTGFMDKLASYLREWAENLVVTSPNLAVIISDASTPGEGEHKIMDYLRRCSDPEARHAVCGQDADLLFLSLALHRPKVYVLRERVPTNNRKQKGAVIKKITGPPDLQLVSTQRLRQYLVSDAELNPMCAGGPAPFPRNDERFLDDFILLCVFVGNDFLPQVPSLSIPDGGLDLVLSLYARALKTPLLGGYLTADAGKGAGQVNVRRVASLLRIVAELEPEILRRRSSRSTPVQQQQQTSDPAVDMAADAVANLCFSGEANLQGAELSALELKTMAETAVNRNAAKVEANSTDLELGKKGFRERYYKKALGKYDEAGVSQMVVEYFRGLRFVASYYHRGLASWSWFYPFHYAPLAVDLARASSEQALYGKAGEPLEVAEPVPPMLQLMAVLPPASSHCCPLAAQKLMNSTSIIKECYPSDFEMDPNGKPHQLRWLWVALLPFVDIRRLREVFDSEVVPLLNEDEQRRNSLKPPELLIGLKVLEAAEGWSDLPASSTISGRVARIKGVECSFALSRVAYELPAIPVVNLPAVTALLGPEAPDDTLDHKVLVASRAASLRKRVRLPASDEAIQRACSLILKANGAPRRNNQPSKILPRPPSGGGKKTPCLFFAQRRCNKGDACPFAHVVIPRDPAVAASA